MTALREPAPAPAGDAATTTPERRPARSSYILRSRRLDLSVRIDRRSVLVCSALVLTMAVGMVASVSLGDFPLPLHDIVLGIFGLGSEDANAVVLGGRLPRALTAILVGAAFATSGAIFQTLARNPLASPDVIGVTAGAGLAAVIAIVAFGAGTTVIAGSSVVGGLTAALLVYGFAYRRGITGYRMVLVGVAISAVGASLTSWLLTQSNIYDAQEASVWLTGSVNNRDWDHVFAVGAALLVLIPVTTALAPRLRALHLGDDTAKGLGVRVEPARLGLIGAAVGMASLATAAAGPVAFAALIAPQIARRLCRASGIALVPAALTGGALVLLSDLVGRRLFAPTMLPVGVITALLGAPFLLWLLARASRSGRGD